MECQVRAAKRDAITVLEGRTCDRPAIDQGLIARPGRQVHENELLVGRSLDERMMTMDGVMLERNVVVAMPSDPQDLTPERNGYCFRPLADVDPCLVADSR